MSGGRSQGSSGLLPRPGKRTKDLVIYYMAKMTAAMQATQAGKGHVPPLSSQHEVPLPFFPCLSESPSLLSDQSNGPKSPSGDNGL